MYKTRYKIGQVRFGWTIIDPLGNDLFCIAICPICKLGCVKRKGNLPADKSCGCTRKKGKESSYKFYYHKYKQAASEDNVVFKLTFEEFKTFSLFNCFYCDAKPIVKNPTKWHKKYFKQESNILYQGIDRIVPQKGYQLSNCVSCCYQCNHIKSNLAPIYFLTYIKRIYKNFNKWKNDPRFRSTQGERTKDRLRKFINE